jgi:hypothetical protein
MNTKKPFSVSVSPSALAAQSIYQSAANWFKTMCKTERLTRDHPRKKNACNQLAAGVL